MPILASFSSSSRTAGFFKPPASASVAGRLYMWGANYYGTGSGSPSYSYAGSIINTPSAVLTWTNIAVGGIGSSYGGEYDFSLFVRADGTLWGVGYSAYGQFGDGSSTKTSIQQIGSATNWSRVACGYSHCVAIKTDGTLWGSGRSEPRGGSSSTLWNQIGSDTNWAQISCGWDHTLALKTDGILWSAGRNDVGQAGTGSIGGSVTLAQRTFNLYFSKIAAGGDGSMAISASGATYKWGSGINTLGSCGSNNGTISLVSGWNFVDISLGYQFGIGITTSGAMFGWGTVNDRGQQGIGYFGASCSGTQIGSSTAWTQVSAGYESSFAINTVGNLFGWGLNNHPSYYNGDPIGQGDCFTQNYSIQLGFNNSLSYTYNQSYAYYSCYSGDCDWNYDTWQPLCCDPGESPTYFSGTYTQYCYAGRYASPVTIAFANANKFLALAQGASANHMAAIRTS